MPAPKNKLKAALRAGKLQTGLWLSLANSYSAEIMGGVGFDWLLIDGEHAPNDIQTIMQQLQALRYSDSSVLVRPPVGDAALIKQLLDVGAQSLLIPMVESGEQAEHLVRSVRYPPRGIRGVGATVARASHFGAIPDYSATADEEILLMLQIENRAGLAALDAIAATEGVDCVFIGPSDLSADLGYLGQPNAPEVRAVIEDAIRRIRAHGKPVGIFMMDPDMARHYIDLGVTFVATGVEALLMARAARELVKLHK
jgi:4-hydroxy-2-oxoheptanedioate aldolase